MQEERWQEYTGDMLGLIVTSIASISGEQTKISLYSELVHPERNKTHAETVEESKAHVYEIFGITPPERG